MTAYSYFKVLGSQCHCSMYYCCCVPEIYAFVPKLCGLMIYFEVPRQARPVAQNINTAPNVYEYSNSLSICNPQAVLNFLCRYFLYDTYPHMRSSHNSIIADNREYFIVPIGGYYCASIQVLILSPLLVLIVSSNICSTFKYFAVSATRLLQVLLMYPLNFKFHMLNRCVSPAIISIKNLRRHARPVG